MSRIHVPALLVVLALSACAHNKKIVAEKSPAPTTAPEAAKAAKPVTPKPAEPAPAPAVVDSKTPEVKPVDAKGVAAHLDNRRPDDPTRIAEAITKSVDLLLAKQETMEKPKEEGQEIARAEWPYEGVYRVGGQIPIGYRVGGTALTATCLLRAPDYDQDGRRKDAVARAVKFICDQTKHPLMSADDYTGGYDVRGWGYTCALGFFLELKAAKAVPDGEAGRVEATIKWAIDSLAKTEIKEVGGWNYAHSPGRDSVCAASPFMTGPSLQALFEAKKQGYAADDGVIDRAIKSLERCRGSTGSFAYAAQKEQRPDSPEMVPGSVGRMLVGEVTLYLAGKSDVARIRGALDAFIVHWDWLDQRRAKPGTHEGPYKIAPYYFYYAHYYAAQAIEMLPKGDRAEYRRRLADLLFSVQMPDGGWNDRVFPRTSNYGTSMAAMSLMMPSARAPARLAEAAGPKVE